MESPWTTVNFRVKWPLLPAARQGPPATAGKAEPGGLEGQLQGASGLVRRVTPQQALALFEHLLQAYPESPFKDYCVTAAKQQRFKLQSR